MKLPNILGKKHKRAVNKCSQSAMERTNLYPKGNALPMLDGARPSAA